MLGLGIGLHKNNFVGGIDPAQAIINAFKTRVLADGGTFEAEQCLKDSLPALIENEPSLCVTPNAVEAGKLFSIIPTDGAGDLNVVRNTKATYVGADGLIQTALANVPRLDYSNGSCPSILVEPQRTNLALQSDMFASGTWNKSSVTANANTTISPSGVQDADTITTTATFNNIAQTITVTASTTYTFSFYALRGSMADLKYSVYNLSGTANIVAPTSYYSQTSASNWVRVSVTFTTPVGCTSINIYPIRDTGVIGTVFLWGAQLEAGANATSYIPTTSATVTRNADVISKTGISSLIGQTEGTFYWEGNLTANAMTIASLRTDSGIINGVIIDIEADNRIRAYIIENNAQKSLVSGLSAITFNSFIKIAYVYKSGNCSLFINGVKQNTNTQTFTFNNTLSRLNVDFIGYNYGGNQRKTKYVKSVLVFPTQLTDAQAIQLTTL